LLFLGRIHPEKGAAECIEVARRTGMKLIMAGIIQDQVYFDTKVRPYLDDDRIVYVGSAGSEKRDELLGGAYALLHPIGFDEPFGLSVVESMACGTPVAAFSRGSMPEIIAHGVTGFLTADIDGMVQAINNVKDLDRSKCRRWVEERFNVGRMVADYVRVYETVNRPQPDPTRRPPALGVLRGFGGQAGSQGQADHRLSRTAPELPAPFQALRALVRAQWHRGGDPKR